MADYPPPRSEASTQSVACDAAELFGWWRAHFRPAQTKHGWRTPGTFEAGKGWPDLVFVRDRVLVVEFKGDDSRGRCGKPTAEQTAWLDTFDRAGVEAIVVGPDDIDALITVLSARPNYQPWTQPEGTQ